MGFMEVVDRVFVEDYSFWKVIEGEITAITSETKLGEAGGRPSEIVVSATLRVTKEKADSLRDYNDLGFLSPLLNF